MSPLRLQKHIRCAILGQVCREMGGAALKGNKRTCQKQPGTSTWRMRARGSRPAYCQSYRLPLARNGSNYSAGYALDERAIVVLLRQGEDGSHPFHERVGLTVTLTASGR